MTTANPHQAGICEKCATEKEWGRDLLFLDINIFSVFIKTRTLHCFCKNVYLWTNTKCVWECGNSFDPVLHINISQEQQRETKKEKKREKKQKQNHDGWDNQSVSRGSKQGGGALIKVQ